MYRVGFKVVGYGIILEVFDVMRHTLRCAIIYWFFWYLVEIALVLELEFSSVKIRNMSGIGSSGGMGTNSNVSDKLNACVVAFESTTKLCIIGKLGEAMYGEEWEESTELSIITCESDTRICERVFDDVVYSIFLGLKMSSVLLDMFSFGLLLLLLLLSSFWSKKNLRIFVFLFNGLFFLIISLSLSMSMYSGGFIEEGLSKANANVLFVLVLCLDNPSRFLLISSESAGGACGRDSLATKTV
jgi:hypothetical protein